MLNAKLFAALAGLMLFIGFLGGHQPFSQLSPVNLILLARDILSAQKTNETLLITGVYARLFLALVCAALALGYFGIARWGKRPPNQVVGLVGFFMVAAGIAVKFSWRFLTGRHPIPDNNIWLFLLYAAAFNAFYWGVLLSAANLAWAGLREGARRVRLRATG